MTPLDNTSTHLLSNYEVEIMSSVASDDLTGNSLLPPITTTTLIAFGVLPLLPYRKSSRSTSIATPKLCTLLIQEYE